MRILVSSTKKDLFLFMYDLAQGRKKRFTERPFALSKIISSV
jgi:hypothetical protein